MIEHMLGRELTAWTVGRSRTPSGPGEFKIDCSLWPAPGANFKMFGRRATFIVGNVSGAPAVAPDFTEHTWSSVKDLLFGWESTIAIEAMSTYGGE